MTLTHLSEGDLTRPLVAVLMHGFGSDQHDLAGIAPALPAGLPWASLRAPIDMDHGGATWFPIGEPGLPDPGSITTATDLVWSWADEHLAPNAKVIAIGFSQGGLMASQLLRTRPDRVATIAILGGFVVAGSQPADPELHTTKPAVFYGRGELDDRIPSAAVQRTEEWLAGHTTAQMHTYPGLGHGINAAELADLNGFLAPLLSGNRN